MGNYIGVLIERKNGVLTNATCLGIRELVKNTSHNSVWLQANGKHSYGHYAKKHADGYLYSHQEHTNAWNGDIDSATVKYYPTNKPIQMTKWQLEREKEKKKEELLSSAKLFLHYLHRELEEFENFNQLVSDGVKQDKKITGEQLVFLADYYKVNIPLRTRGYYLNKLYSVSATEIRDREVLRISYATEGKLNRDILYRTLEAILEAMYPEEVTAEEQETFGRLFKKAA